MRVLWLTGRSMKDLCSTTQRALILGLHDRGVAVTLVNADDKINLEGRGLTHVSLPNQARRGFQSRTLGKAMNAWLSNNLSQGTVALVEWPIAKWVVAELEQQGIPWALMDRSPPADSGWLGRLQWRDWKTAWRAAARADASGFVVSEAHRTFVEQKTGHRKITVLHAGVDLDLFRPLEQRAKTTMVYHGRLDRHRGVLACAMLAQKAHLAGFEVDVVFVGEGDLMSSLTALGQENDFIHVHATLAQHELAELLGTCHVGLLPMPATTVWRLASPLKRSEYLAAGLLVVGIDHDGHRLEGVDKAWYRLLAQEDFLSDGVAWLKQLDEDRLAEGRRSARAFAESSCAWTTSVDILENQLHSIHDE